MGKIDDHGILTLGIAEEVHLTLPQRRTVPSQRQGSAVESGYDGDDSAGDEREKEGVVMTRNAGVVERREPRWSSGVRCNSDEDNPVVMAIIIVQTVSQIYRGEAGCNRSRGEEIYNV